MTIPQLSVPVTVEYALQGSVHNTCGELHVEVPESDFTFSTCFESFTSRGILRVASDLNDKGKLSTRATISLISSSSLTEAMEKHGKQSKLEKVRAITRVKPQACSLYQSSQTGHASACFGKD
jgi:hypothetical protein